ncbi:transcriptional regulator [Pseudomonas sp. MYb185]|nr:transcriptional regulator [Pseudomonas sp. MYb185]
MGIQGMLSDEAILAELGSRIARQRLDMGYTQAMLAEQAGVSKRTLERLEAGASTQLTSFIRILRVLGLLHGLDQLLPEQGPSPMALLRGKGKVPRRVRPAAPAGIQQPDAAWQWGDES